jgi:hypothetical protein
MTDVIQYNEIPLKHKRSFDETFNNSNNPFNNSNNSFNNSNNSFSKSFDKPFQFNAFNEQFNEQFNNSFSMSLNKKTKCLQNDGFLLNQSQLTQPDLNKLNENKIDICLEELKKLNEKISLVVLSIDLINKKIDKIDQTLKNVFGETEKSNDIQFDSYCSYIS